MKAKNKAMALALSAIMIVTATTFGTMAYLTHDVTVENTFTVGNVELTDGTSVSTYASEEDPLIDGDIYRLVPGHLYLKPMSAAIGDESETAWVFIRITNDIAELEYEQGATVIYQGQEVVYDTIATQLANNCWVPIEGYDGVYYYHGDTEEATPVVGGTPLWLFDYFAIDGDKVVGGTIAEAQAEGKYNEAFYYLGEYEGKKLSVTTYAVQSDGLKGPVDAWEKVFGTGGQSPVDFTEDTAEEAADSTAADGSEGAAQ